MIAMPELSIMALPIPWIHREAINMVPDAEKAHKRVETVKKMLPYSNIFLLPMISASLPKGTSMTAENKRKPMAIQLSDTAFIDSSLLMLGRAIFTAEPMKGLKKEDIMTTARRMPRLIRVSVSADMLPDFRI
jgi:hypothetical protein